jgi:hypothetical protein
MCYCGEFHTACEVTCVTVGSFLLPGKLNVLLSKLAGTIVLLTCVAKCAAQILAISMWFCCGFAQLLNADALLVHYIMLWTLCLLSFCAVMQQSFHWWCCAVCATDITVQKRNTWVLCSLAVCVIHLLRTDMCSCPRTVTCVWYLKTCVYHMCAQDCIKYLMGECVTVSFCFFLFFCLISLLLYPFTLNVYHLATKPVHLSLYSSVYVCILCVPSSNQACPSVFVFFCLCLHFMCTV